MPHFLPPQTPSSRLPPHGWDFRLRPPVSPTSPTTFSRGAPSQRPHSWPNSTVLISTSPSGVATSSIFNITSIAILSRARWIFAHTRRFLHVCLLPALNNFVISFCATPSSNSAPISLVCRLVLYQVYSVHRSVVHQLYHVYHLALHQFQRVSQLAQHP